MTYGKVNLKYRKCSKKLNFEYHKWPKNGNFEYHKWYKNKTLNTINGLKMKPLIP